MAARLRVFIDELQDLANPTYRLGDHLRRVKGSLAQDEEVIKDVLVEVGFEDDFQSTKSFGVPADGNVKLGAVLFVKAPPPSHLLTFRVLKSHRIQKDALIGEAQVRKAGAQKLTLMRSGKPRGVLLVEVSDGLPEKHPASSSAGGLSLPSAALRRDSPAEAPAEVAPRASALSGCSECVTGLMEMLGLTDRNARFLAEKRSDPRYKVTPSGLTYRVLKKGAGGHHPRPTSICDCHYKGQLINGFVFDSSVRHGGPQHFGVGDVVKGWTEALQLMVEGDKFELILPPELAYRDQAIRGENGAVLIPANSVLVFEMELLRIRESRR